MIRSSHDYNFQPHSLSFGGGGDVLENEIVTNHAFVMKLSQKIPQVRGSGSVLAGEHVEGLGEWVAQRAQKPLPTHLA